jgi:hypothetical protein
MAGKDGTTLFKETGIGGHTMINKGQKVSVEGGARTINCDVADIDVATGKIWVRLPTNNMIVLKMNSKTNRYEGRIAGLDLFVDLDTN